MLGGPFRFGICRFWYSFKMAISRLYWTDRASPFKCWHSASTASSSSGVQVRPFLHSLSFRAEGYYHHPPGPPGPGSVHVCSSWPLARPPCQRGVHHLMDRREEVFPVTSPGILSRNLRPGWKAVRSDLPGLTSGGWRLILHGHLRRVRAL